MLELKGTLSERLRLLATYAKGGSDVYPNTMREAADALDERDALLRDLHSWLGLLEDRASRDYSEWIEAGDLRVRLTDVVGRPALGNPPGMAELASETA